MLQHVGQLHLFRAKTPTETFHQASAGGLCFQMSLSVKNKRDRLFFTQLFVPQASQSSYDRRAELDVRLAIPSAQSACGMEIFTKNGMAVSAMPFSVVKGTTCGKAMYKRCKML